MRAVKVAMNFQMILKRWTGSSETSSEGKESSGEGHSETSSEGKESSGEGRESSGETSEGQSS